MLRDPFTDRSPVQILSTPYEDRVPSIQYSEWCSDHEARSDFDMVFISYTVSKYTVSKIHCI